MEAPGVEPGEQVSQLAAQMMRPPLQTLQKLTLRFESLCLRFRRWESFVCVVAALRPMECHGTKAPLDLQEQRP
jgi:hypothetical protein